MVPRQSSSQQPHSHPVTWLAPPSREESPHSKISLIRSTHSNEADDERSSFSDDDIMGPVTRRGGYEGEDTRLTSKKELAGFYAYGWASEVFVVCGMGAFIPITLEQLARERGVLQSDHTTPCSSNFEVPEPPFNTTLYNTLSKPKRAEQCVVNILGTEVNTASFAMYTFSISVLLQTLLILSMSGAADHGQYRKTLLVSLATVGAIATMLFLPVTSDVFLLGALFAIIANTCYGASAVLLNSFLPLLVRYHPETQYPSPSSSGELATEQDDSNDEYEDEEDDPSRHLLPDPEDTEEFISRSTRRATTGQELRLSTRISANGMAIGYVAAVTVQTLSIVVILIFKDSSDFALRLALFIVGAWWLIFTMPAALWLRPRPGPPLHLSEDRSKAGTWMAYFTYSWESLGRTLMHARQLKDLLLFLGAWALLSDGIATVSGTATLFAKTTLGMEAAALALINIIVVLSGIVGAFAWSRLSVYMGLKPSHTILACICVLELIPLYGLLGYIPAVKRWGVLGLQQQWELYPLGAVYGFVLGGLSSYCRALFGELIPEGFEAAFYALFAITDKGSSVFGPAIVGAIIDSTGEVRPAFVFLAILIGMPIPLMALVDVERGRRDGVAMSKRLSDNAEPEPERGSDGYGTIDTPGPRRARSQIDDSFDDDAD